MAGFLGIKKPVAPQVNKEKVSTATPSPIQPIKPVSQVKPQPIKPVAQPARKDGPILPGGGLIKPVKPKTEEKEKEVKEEKLTLNPTPAAEETVVEKKETVEAKKEEVKDKPVVVVETKEEVKEEVKEEKKEETPKETKKKTTRRSTKKKEETETEFVPEEIPTKNAEEYNEIIASTIIYSAGADWDKQVSELNEQLKSIVIEPDMNTATMKQAMSDLVKLKDVIFSEYTLSKTILEAAERKIDLVKGLNAKGSSADERKLNSLKACVEYKEGDLTINLFELFDVASVKFNFYESLMKQIDFKAKSLITMNGALKLEKEALGL